MLMMVVMMEMVLFDWRKISDKAKGVKRTEEKMASLQ